MNWIKSHKLLTAGLVVGVIVLYYVYKTMQSNAAAANANPGSGLPNFVYVGGGSGGSGGGNISSPGSGASVTPVASGSTPSATPSIAVTPGASPMPVVSAPASQNVSSGVVNSPTGEAGTPSSQFPSSVFQVSPQDNASAMPVNSPWYATPSNPNPNPTAAQLAAAYPAPPPLYASPDAGKVNNPGGLLPYQQYIANEIANSGGHPTQTNTPVAPAGSQPLTPLTAASVGTILEGLGGTQFQQGGGQGGAGTPTPGTLGANFLGNAYVA